MYEIGEHVTSILNGDTGVVEQASEQVLTVRWDDGQREGFNQVNNVLRATQLDPAPSQSADPVHAAMLRHARNAGAAVTALEIIRRDAIKALKAHPEADNTPHAAALQFIHRFADDVLSHVLPS